MASYSSSVTVNVNMYQPAYTSLGLGPIPAGTSPDDAVKGIQQKLLADLKTSWPANFPTLTSQENAGIMEPWTANVAGTAPSCVVQQFQSSFDGWDIPYSQAQLNQMAIEITTNIADNAGIKGFFYGKSTLNANEHIYWAVGYMTAVVIDPDVNGIIYAFTAVLDD